MDIAVNKFPHEFTENNVLNPETFKTNEDYKINHVKKISSQAETEVNCVLNICKDEFMSLYQYIANDLASTKKLFIAKFNLYGDYKEYICDMISNPRVNYKNNRFEISFKVAIIKENI
jgi:hypothetical protein